MCFVLSVVRIALPDSDSVLGCEVECITLLNVEQLIPVVNVLYNAVDADVAYRVYIPRYEVANI